MLFWWWVQSFEKVFMGMAMFVLTVGGTISGEDVDGIGPGTASGKGKGTVGTLIGETMGREGTAPLT
jgi:hypothetical protein